MVTKAIIYEPDDIVQAITTLRTVAQVFQAQWGDEEDAIEIIAKINKHIDFLNDVNSIAETEPPATNNKRSFKDVVSSLPESDRPPAVVSAASLSKKPVTNFDANRFRNLKAAQDDGRTDPVKVR